MLQYARYPSLEGNRVVVTGGATGIGEAIVEAFSRNGAHVAFLDVNSEAGTRLAERLAPAVHFRSCDVRDAAALEDTLLALECELGGIDVLINNVANDERHSPDELDATAWRNNLAVNLDPAFLAARTVSTGMLRQGKGTIINLCSINASLAPADLVAYNTAKSGIVGMTKSLARAWGPGGIRVNAVSPGWIVTERQLSLWLTPEAEQAWMREVSLKKRIEPSDVARLVLFLGAEDSAMITGQNLIIDGGRT